MEKKRFQKIDDHETAKEQAALYLWILARDHRFYYGEKPHFILGSECPLCKATEEAVEHGEEILKEFKKDR